MMDTVFKGHPYVKAALDMACKDLAARAAGVPLVTMLGGQYGERAELYRSSRRDRRGDGGAGEVSSPKAIAASR